MKTEKRACTVATAASSHKQKIHSFIIKHLKGFVKYEYDKS